ncbi:hypothetical protein GPECTOR_4g620 [Gonium pectorale]|uniref:Uncharacterized protein n=1 Tax=Gonium pectorale TaxID=33097 RepID=A0A150GXL7_GONPE|nr:hypothetical protein GPECTOR_4g620 [Gonium pectorale]|eukprot:KXZ54555.1 hypothetical protein GPECTOR_4g620 [Gonium pectorale]
MRKICVHAKQKWWPWSFRDNASQPKQPNDDEERSEQGPIIYLDVTAASLVISVIAVGVTIYMAGAGIVKDIKDDLKGDIKDLSSKLDKALDEYAKLKVDD